MPPALPSLRHALELARRLGAQAAPPDHEARPAELRPAVAEGVAALARLVMHPGRGWAAELTRARGAVWHALRVLAVAERHAVELHHAAPVRLPPGAEARAEVAALALLEVGLAGRDVRPAMVRRLGRVLRRQAGPAEALVMAAELPPLGPLAEALMEIHGELAGAGIVGLALGASRAVAE
jgi:hypothetical protein